MTLDEAIKHYEEVADVQFDRAVRYEDAKCGKFAEEYHQLAEWLKELKRYKAIKNPDEIGMLRLEVKNWISFNF